MLFLDSDDEQHGTTKKDSDSIDSAHLVSGWRAGVLPRSNSKLSSCSISLSMVFIDSLNRSALSVYFREPSFFYSV